jgi:tRNA(Arg) A34 adenosine deaminase TadA
MSSIATLERRAASLERELAQTRREQWAERQRTATVSTSDGAKLDPKVRQAKLAKHLEPDIAERKLALIEDAIKGIEQTLRQACRAGRYGKAGCCMAGPNSRACSEQTFELDSERRELIAARQDAEHAVKKLRASVPVDSDDKVLAADLERANKSLDAFEHNEIETVSAFCDKLASGGDFREARNRRLWLLGARERYARTLHLIPM